MIKHNNNNSLKFAFLGDLFLGGEFITYAEKNQIDLLRPFHYISNYFSDAEILFVNFEGPIFSGPNKRKDVTVHISNHPSIIEFLKKFKICVLNLANNHIMDYGPEGLDKTLFLLKANKLNYIGAGRNAVEADKELIIEYKSRKIAFIGYTTNELYVGSVIAQHDKPGCATYLDLDKVLRKVQDLKKEVDVICVSLHWGHEYHQYPSHSQVAIAHALVDAGANYIIGHHPHVIQGIESYNKSLIIYSLGNFFFSPVRSTKGRLLYQKPLTKEFMIVRSTLSESDTIGYDFLAGYINKDYCFVPFFDADLQMFMQKMSSLSRPISDANYDKYWEAYQEKRRHELSHENLIEAFRKLSGMSFKDIATTVGIDDIKRNIKRLHNIFFKSA